MNIMEKNTTLEEVLVQYRKIEKELAQLEEQKLALRQQIETILVREERTFYTTILGDERIALELKQQTTIQYNEPILRQRLGKRYLRILMIDTSKIKQHLDELSAVLHPYLEKIGTPSRNLIKDAILKGEIEPSLFQGAFEKKQRTTLYVKKRLLHQEAETGRPY